MSVLHVQQPGNLSQSFAALDGEAYCDCSTQECGYTWLKITEVCRYWREVALLSPRLWGDILVTHPQWMGKVIDRSGQAPLHVYARLGSRPEKFDALKIVFQKMHRVVTLNISLPRMCAPELAEYLCDLPASLTSLQLSLDRSTPRDMSHPDFSKIHLHSHRPQLRHVDVMGSPFMRWTSSILCATITTLSWRSSRDSQDNVKMLEILDALGAMPCLESIVLKMPYPRRS